MMRIFYTIKLFNLKFANNLMNTFIKNDKRTAFLGKIHFDFDLKVQWLVKSQKERNPKNLNIFKITGFKFIVNEYYEEFQSNDDIMLQEFKDIIRKKLNQCNFHDYYKAIKKIGKGNFASVSTFF